MERVYTENPENFIEIEPHIITDKNLIAREIICAKRCYFYDTCAFRNHMKCDGKEYIISHILNNGGIVIITRLILMELLSGDNNLWPEHISYIRAMHQAGIKVIVMYEEDVYDVLETYFSTYKEINKRLQYAVQVVKSPCNAVNEYLERNSDLKHVLWGDIQKQTGGLCGTFFTGMREHKTSGDNLGEELLGICVHMLSNIPDRNPFKYVVLSDDKGAVRVIADCVNNQAKHGIRKAISCMTTPALIYCMVKEGDITESDDAVNVGNACATEGFVRIFASQTYELSPSEKRVTVEAFAEALFDSAKALTVYW